MVLWHHSSHQSSSASAASSRPSSRAPSPTRTNTRTSIQSGSSIPITVTPSVPSLSSRSNTIESSDALSNYTGSAQATPGTSPAVSQLPSGFPAYASSEMWREGSGTGTHTPGGYFGPTQPLDIVLDSEHLVMRGQGGDTSPAYLSGRIELNLHESTNIREITMTLQGKAKVSFTESQTGRNHHHTHPILHHDWSFLEGDKRHTHTLKAGHHSFPFSLMIDGSLPSTISTYSGDATISYKLRATVVRSGFTTSNYATTKTFSLHRTYTPDALEFNQTLEIENTWPGKIMYALTLPFKAYAAGDEIPVAVKFMPLAKGVRVVSVTSVIKEYSLVHTRHSSHPDTRVAASTKHELRNGRAYPATTEPIRPPVDHTFSLSSSRHDSSAGDSRHPSPSATPLATLRGLPNLSAPSSRAPSLSGPSAAGPSSAGPSTFPESGTEEENIEIGDDEVNTSFTITIPTWTTPSHSVHPVFITHKIKWSCSISNPDGHFSELRCALPIIILDHSLLDEARAAGAATRALLFGGEAEEVQQVDLPSYSNHVYDRVAADSGATTGYVARSAQHTPLPSPHGETPPHSRTPSRPVSPSRERAFATADPIPAGEVPPRPELTQWADSELLLSLGALRVHSNATSPSNTPPDSRAPSRPLSRRNSRSGRSSVVGSRAGSRASSPERHSPHSGSYVDERPLNERRGSGFTGRLHLLRPLSGAKPILRNSSGASIASPMSATHPHGHGHGHDGIQRNAQSFTNLSNGHVSFGGETRRHFIIDPEQEVPAISRVPAYDIASRGFAGALDAGPPTYDDSERMIERTRSETELSSLVRPRSDTALVELGARAAAAAEERANEQESEVLQSE